MRSSCILAAGLACCMLFSGCGSSADSKKETTAGAAEYYQAMMHARTCTAEILEGAVFLNKYDAALPALTGLQESSEEWDRVAATLPAEELAALKQKFGKEYSVTETRLAKVADTMVHRQIDLRLAMAKLIDKVDSPDAYKNTLPAVDAHENEFKNLRLLLMKMPKDQTDDLYARFAAESDAAQGRMDRAMSDMQQRLNKKLPDLKLPKK